MSEEILEYEGIDPVRLEDTELICAVELKISQLEELSAPLKVYEADEPLSELERIDDVA